jgi:hypothetical protein
MISLLSITLIKMAKDKIEIGKIKPYDRNAKKHSKKQVEQIADSIKEFGFNQPIVIDKKGIIVVGHGRYEAAMLLKLEEVPVKRVDLTDEQARRYRVMDNKLNESEWIVEMLELEIADLPELKVEFADIVLGDALGDDFSLDDSDKNPFGQMTFILAEKQADIVKGAMSKAKKAEGFGTIDNHGNQNGNGNALFFIINEWIAQNL